MKFEKWIDNTSIDESKKYSDDDWVVVYQRQPVQFIKNPKSDKAPTGKIKTSKYDEILRVSRAKKMGIIKEAMGFVQKLPYQMKEKPVKKPPVDKVKTSDLKRKVNKPMDIKKAVIAYVKGVQKIMDMEYKRYEHVDSPEIIFKKGGRYYKVIKKERTGTGTSVHSFIDGKEGPTFGDILKPASWRAPAKGARGNVFSTQNGLEAIGKSGTGGVWYAR